MDAPEMDALENQLRGPASYVGHARITIFAEPATNDVTISTVITMGSCRYQGVNGEENKQHHLLQGGEIQRL